MTGRRFASFCLLVAGVTIILTGGGEEVNGFTLLGAILALGGIVLAD